MDVNSKEAELWTENMKLKSELEYAYLCITHGFSTNVFDFSVLHDRAREFLAETPNR